MNEWLSMVLCAALLGGCGAPVEKQQAGQQPGPQVMGGPPDEGASIAASLGYHGPPARDDSQRP